VLLLACSGQRFAIPQTAVAEVVRAGSEHRIECFGDGSLLRLRGGLLPLVSLSDLLQLGATRRADNECLVVVLGYGAQRFGLIVDGVDASEEIVVKALAPMLRGTRLFAGSTILGDGSVSLILDPGALAKTARVAETVESVPISMAVPNHAPRARDEGLLLFRAGGGITRALRLGSVLRIEEIEPDQIERIEGQAVMPYRGAALPLHLLGAMPQSERRLVVIVAHDGRMCGFLADTVIDTVDHKPALDRSRAGPGVLGAATIAEGAVEIVDAAYYTKAASTRLPPPKLSAA
jgi:two-component system chemotaxis sensor kinase CheA